MNWHDVTLEQYYQIMRAEDAHKNKYVQIAAKVAIVSGMPFDKIKKMTPKQFTKFAEDYVFVDTEVPEVSPKDAKVWDKYTFISHMKDIKAGQSFDLLTILEGDTKECFHKLLASMATGTDLTWEERCDDILKRMPVPIALSHVGFFLPLLNGLESNARRYLRMILRVKTWRLKRQIRRFINGSMR